MKNNNQLLKNSGIKLNQIIEGYTLPELRKIPAASIDLIITSPPYNKKEKDGGVVPGIKYDKFVDNKDEKAYQDEQVEVLDELYSVCKPGGSLFYNHKERRDDDGVFQSPLYWIKRSKWYIRQHIIWNRHCTTDIGSYHFMPVYEEIYWLYKPVDAKHKAGEQMGTEFSKLTNIWDITPERQKVKKHPAPFPLRLPARIIMAVLKEGGVVLDPYMGSGTTAVAAKMLGKNYLGIDCSPNYIKNANERIANCFSDPKAVEAVNTEKRLVGDTHLIQLQNHYFPIP
jgi:modification methylase